jgi:nucleoside-diphosphate-sugar epimerase
MNIFCFGLGYSAERFHQLYSNDVNSFTGTTRSPEKQAALKAKGVEAHVMTPGRDNPALEAAMSSADYLLVSAAPDGAGDPILREYETQLMRCSRLKCIIYWSTVGVYGDHGGRWIDETAPLKAISERGQRRIIAEKAWTALGKKLGISVQLHRLAGIYGPTRSLIDDYREGTARRIIKEGQVFNRIHVDDIAGAVFKGFHHPEMTGPFNICDDLPCPPQDVVVFASEILGMPPPSEIPFAEAILSPMGRSFYSESKRCSNKRLKQDLGYEMRYPTYESGLQAILTNSHEIK